MAKINLPTSIDKLVNAWKLLAPDALFSEMTLDQFLAEAKPTVTIRERISELTQERKASLATRKASDGKTNTLFLRVVNSIKGSPSHGEDSPLYRALGYKTKSERRSGLTRKVRNQSGNVVAN